MGGPYQPNYLKSKNRKLVFDLFKEHKELSRAQIARLTEMSFPTAMRVVDFLISKDVVRETGQRSTDADGPGRKSKLLQFNPEAFHAIGVEVEGSIVNIGQVNLQGEIIERRSVHITSHFSLDYFDEVLDTITLLKELSETPVLGVGIGFPGNINHETSEIVSYNPLRITKPTSFTDLLPLIHEKLDIPILIDNDVNLACAGEHLVSQNQHEKSLVYISLGTGLGSGFLIDGKVWRGDRFSAGEIGNLLLAPLDSKEMTFPGIANLENLINIQALQNTFDVSFDSGNPIPLQKQEEIIRYLVPYLGALIFNLLNILDIRHVVLAGLIPAQLNPLLQNQLEALFATVPEEIGEVTISAPLSEYPVLSGAASMVFDKLIFDEFAL